jgi:hypothetical protein
VASLEPAPVANDATIDRRPNCCPEGPCNSTLGKPSVVAIRATTANGEIGFSPSRDVCRVTIHSDARGLCPNRNDGHDLRAPYVRDHDRGRRVPERYHRRFAQRREPAATSASPRPVAWVLSPMRQERRHRSAENDSLAFLLGPRLRGAGQCPRSLKVPSKATLTAVVADVPADLKAARLRSFRAELEGVRQRKQQPGAAA